MLTTIQIIDLILSSVFTLVIAYFLLIITKKPILLIPLGILYIADFLLNFFALTTASEILNCIIITILFLFLNYYSSNVRKLFRGKNKTHVSTLDDKDKEVFIEVLNEAVIDLSSTKTGALITIETEEDLTEFIEKGEKIEAPLSSTILRTIFYPGTPLHDGAIIIRGNIVEAGAIFYTPTTKAMVGKYGARHRAAMGFSENHNAITIVVSEETGRISFAENGELINAAQDTFKKRLREYLK